MSTLESLHRLLHSLNSDNQRALKYVLGEKKTPTHARILHDLLVSLTDKTISQTETKWRKTMVANKYLSIKSLQNAQTVLKQKIYEAKCISLRFSQGGNAEERLYLADVFIHEENYDQAYQILSDFVNDTTHFSKYEYRIQILQKLIWLHPHVQIESSDKQLNLLRNELNNIIHNLQLFHKIYQLNLDVTDLYKRSVIMKSDESITRLKSLQQSTLLSLDIDTLEPIAANYLLKTQSMLHYLSLDNESMFLSLQRLCLNMRKYEKQYLTTIEFHNYISEHINLCICAAHGGNLTCIKETVKYVQSIKHHNQQFEAFYTTQCELVFALYYYYKHDDINLASHIIITDNLASSLTTLGPAMVGDTMKLSLMKCWLRLKDYNKVAYWFGDMLTQKAIVRLDTFYTRHIVYFCSLYEQSQIKGKEIFVPEMAKNTIININTMHTLSKSHLPLEHSVSTCFNHLVKDNLIEQHKYHIGALLHKLAKLPEEGHIYQEQFYRIFNLRAWLFEMLEKLSAEQK